MASVNPFPFLELEKQLPRLPVPELESTLNLYLEQLRPLVSAQAWSKAKQHATEFLDDSSQGAHLHAEVEKMAAEAKTSWLEGFWDTWYLEDRGPAPINVNPFFIIHPTPNMNQLARASALVHSSARFIASLRRGQIPGDEERGGVPLCMTQYGRVFGTTRVPQGDRDLLRTYGDSKHAVVMRRNAVFSLSLFDETGAVASRAAIEGQLRFICHYTDSSSAWVPMDGSEEGGVGMLTCEPRTAWSAARNEILSFKNNAEALHTIDSALLVLCLDDESPDTADEVSRLMLHGRDGANRWFDKLQLIVTSNGQAAWNMEHSPYDGHTLLQVATYVFNDMTAKAAIPGSANTKEAVVVTAPKRLRWQLQSSTLQRISVAKVRMAALCAKTETSVLDFSHFGGSWIKQQKMSPDAFVQMAYQLAYYKLHSRVESTYESCNTKRFYHGRTEVIRVVSDQSKTFCETMSSAGSSMKDRAAAMRQAVAQHIKTGRRAKKAMAADRHLFGMWWVARQERQKVVDRPLPPLFADPSYAKFCGSVLSTSNCGGASLDLFGFGPVMSNGLGIGYMVKKDSIHVNVTSFVGEARRYAVLLQQSLLDMKVVCDAEAQSKLSAKL